MKHSTTKYLHGHGWAIGGVLIGRNIEFMKTKVFETLKLFGGNSNAFDAWLLLHGMKTLELRMIRHCENAMKVAEFLEKVSKLKKKEEKVRGLVFDKQVLDVPSDEL